MPLGDPHGGNFEYTDEGLPIDLFMATIPSRNPAEGSRFYTDVLMMDVLYESPDEVVMRRSRCTVRLRRSEAVGVDTGVFIGVDDPYDLHRRLIDEGVRFKMDPKRLPMGVATSFFDFDGNILYAIERGAVPYDGDMNHSGDTEP